MYERHTEGLIPTREFLRRVARHGGLSGGVVLFSLIVGTIGFHLLAPQDWLDAFLNSAMLLGGMGLVGGVERPAGKVFASFYALYAGIVFLGSAALFLAPVVHRVVHTLRSKEQRRHH